MVLPSQRWLKLVFFATVLVFASVAVYLYALRFFVWAESDSAVPVLLASRILDAKRPVVESWYYANGDVWLLAPQLLALLPVAVLGVGPASLLISVAGGFALELVILVRAYARLCDERWVAVLAAVVTMAVWSSSHVAYVYVQLSYGFATVVYLLVFLLVARLVEAPPRRWPWLAAVGLLAVIAAQNPTRGAVFLLAPVLAGCVWPWRALAWRRRLAVAAAMTAGWAVAWLGYTRVLAPAVQFSVPRGHIDFRVAGLHGMAANLARFGRGLIELCAGDGRVVWALPGLLVLIGALVLVGAEVLSARVLTAMRFVCVVIGAQVVLVCVPLVIGNLLVSPDSVRYVLPGLLTMFGLAVILAVRALATRGWLRWLAVGWLGLVPVAALVAAREARPPAPVRYVWPDLPELSRIADELVNRKLVHGFANVLSANVLNLDSHGATLACPVYFRGSVMPQRWLADTSCYRAAELPAQFYVVTDQTEHDAASVREALPAPVDRFHVGPMYEVLVFRTADNTKPWLELPLADGVDARFPMEIAATHLQMSRGESTIDGSAVVATGQPGTVIYGPYIALPKGRYELIWIGRATDTPGKLAFSVRAAGGRKVFAQLEAAAGELPRTTGELCHLAFRLDRAYDGVEFLVHSSDGGRVALDRLIVRRP